MVPQMTIAALPDRAPDTGTIRSTLSVRLLSSYSTSPFAGRLILYFKERTLSQRILIVDDDPAILNMLYKVVCSNGFDAVLSQDGADALEKCSTQHFDLMLLDINMRGIDGFQVLQTLRGMGNEIPVIIVSGRKEDYDALYGYNLGADDYVTKPFNPVTLGAKIKALLRRMDKTGDSSPLISVGPFSYNTSTLRFYKNEEEIPLSGKENALLKLLIDNANHICSKDMIYDMVWGQEILDENAVMVYINRLRQKIEEDPSNPRYIQNIRGLGYKFVV